MPARAHELDHGLVTDLATYSDSAMNDAGARKPSRSEERVIVQSIKLQVAVLNGLGQESTKSDVLGVR